MRKPRPQIVLTAALVWLAACSGSSVPLDSDSGIPDSGGVDDGGDSGVEMPLDGGWTYYHDIQPIMQTKCASCHTTDGIAPFPLLSYQDVATHLDGGFDGGPGIVSAVMTGLMPPWPPSSSCNDYQYNRALTPDESTALLTWAMSGAPAGDIADQQFGIPPGGGLSRTDLTLAMPAAYTPVLTPDDYRCFLLDWPVQTATHVTGILVRPGSPSEVHHSIVYLVPPEDVAAYEAIDAGPGQVGYTCFGGPAGNSGASFSGILGAWVPGNSAAEYPTGTGITVQPGSKIVVQMHYNTTNGVSSDLSAIDFKLDETVPTEAALFIYTNPLWVVSPSTMLIPAGQADVEHSFLLDMDNWLNLFTHGALPNGAFKIYTALNHMHLRGSQEKLQVVHSDGSKECLLDTASWDFRWQGSYYLQAPVQFQAGDMLSVDCHWDNSAEHQPVQGGVKVAPIDLMWGEGTNDEMCLGAFFVTQ